MATYILIDKSGLIVNRIEWDGTSRWKPPHGLTAIAYAEPCEPGWRWDGAKAVPPAAPEPPPASGGDGEMEIL